MDCQLPLCVIYLLELLTFRSFAFGWEIEIQKLVFITDV